MFMMLFLFQGWMFLVFVSCILAFLFRIIGRTIRLGLLFLPFCLAYRWLKGEKNFG